MRFLIMLAFFAVIAVAPLLARAQERDPLSTPLRQYGFMLATALLGGLVSWVAKVRKGEIAAWNLMQLVGELCTSAFAGLMCFWLCQAAGLQIAWTVPLVGIAGHMGTRAIALFEDFAERRWGEKFPPITPPDVTIQKPRTGTE